MVSDAAQPPSFNVPAISLDDEAFSRLALRDDLPLLGLSLDELLLRVYPERKAAA